MREAGKRVGFADVSHRSLPLDFLSAFGGLDVCSKLTSSNGDTLSHALMISYAEGFFRSTGKGRL